jgi:hypothetical protein
VTTRTAWPSKYTPAEKQNIIKKLRAAAVAVAEYWDALRAVEVEHRVTIETGPELISNIAADCDVPPNPGNLSDECIWEWFIDSAKAEVLS